MRNIRVRTKSRGTVVLLAASAVMLACAGTGLAGALPPLPTKVQDSAAVPVTLISTSASIKAPLPPVKPQTYAPVVLTPHLTGQVEEPDMDAIAEDMSKIEPSVFHPAAPVPQPGRKPDFAEPAVETLLSFGTPPVPKAKPLPHTKDALSNRDAGLYRDIFAAQAVGNWETADDNIRQLKDMRLRGHVLFQRYMHPSYKAKFEELQAWMDMYSDHPGADRIYKLAQLRMPSGYTGALKKHRNQIGVQGGVLRVLSSAGTTYVSTSKRSKTQSQDVQRLIKAVHADIGRGAPSRGLKRVTDDKAAKLMDAAEYDQLRGQIAMAYMMLGKTEDARILSKASAGRSGQKAPMAGWAGGLAAWREKNYRDAARMFELTAQSPYTSRWMQSAGAYWAARSHMRAGNPKEVRKWLEAAAKQPRTFYGLIATRTLGWDFDFNWDIPEYTDAHFEKLVSIPAAWRAMALVQAGQNHLAEAELIQVGSNGDAAITDALLAYTQHANLPGLAMRIANNRIGPDGSLYDAALYPMLPWQPKGGYSIDRALIHAIIRQESKFNTWAKSGSGATGLMQLMPETASYVTGTHAFREKAGKHQLTDPETNLQIGQKYVSQLLEQQGVDNDLLSMAIAYNAGPGNLRKWKRELSEIDDPLLFIEMIPMAETRNYVEQVLANYWIYRLRLDQPTPTLDAVAEGKWAYYVPMDDNGASVRLASAF